MSKQVVIARVAFIEKCSNCWTHAHIKYPDGSISGEFFSRIDGHRLVKEALRLSLMEEDNAAELHREVDELELLEGILPNKMGTALRMIVEHSEEITQGLVREIHDLVDQLTNPSQSLPGESPLQDEDGQKNKH